jgi:hypothetical protein
MSLDVYLEKTIYSRNITHNLGKMADEAGIYKALWRPDEEGYWNAADLIQPLSAGLKLLLAEPERFKKFNPENGWGNYDNLVAFVSDYLDACIENPESRVRACR